jgi:hypothetical protein
MSLDELLLVNYFACEDEDDSAVVVGDEVLSFDFSTAGGFDKGGDGCDCAAATGTESVFFVGEFEKMS